MNVFLIIAGIFSASAALLHLGCIYYGAAWYRFLGASEQMALLADQGSIRPTLITTVIFGVLSIWSLYAFSGAGLIFPLPYTRLALVAMTVIYLVRGFAGLFLIVRPLGRTPSFWLWSSLICLSIGVVHAIGLTLQWQYL